MTLHSGRNEVVIDCAGGRARKAPAQNGLWQNLWYTKQGLRGQTTSLFFLLPI